MTDEMRKELNQLPSDLKDRLDQSVTAFSIAFPEAKDAVESILTGLVMSAFYTGQRTKIFDT